MEKFIIFLIILFIKAQSFSQTVDLNLALKVAKNYYSREISRYNMKNGGTGNNKTKNIITWKYNNHNSYFIINFEEGGWVIVPAHKSRGPVLGYSYSGTIHEDLLAESFIAFMNTYDRIIDFSIKTNKVVNAKLEEWDDLEDSARNYNTLKSSGISPNHLLETNWGQGFYPNCGYNDLMPPCEECRIPCNMNNYCDQKCMAGCGPVAMAQILNFWGYATGSYADFDWWKMEEVGFTSAVPYLIKRCGDRLGVGYCSRGCASGFEESEWVMKAAFRDFGYKVDDIQYKQKSILIQFNTWVNWLKDEIIAGRPVFYGIPDHNIICEGYNYENDNFYWNFGFNGRCDGWFDFEDMDCDWCEDEDLIRDCSSNCVKFRT